MKSNDKEIKEIEKNNKLLAKFIGIEKVTLGWSDNKGNLTQFIYDQTGGNIFEKLHFHESWDWLMSVIDKINYSTSYGDINRIFSNIKKALFSVNLKDTYKAIVKFIKWYNKEKNKRNING